MASDSEGGSSAMVSLVSSATRIADISTELVIKEERAQWSGSHHNDLVVGWDGM